MTLESISEQVTQSLRDTAQRHRPRGTLRGRLVLGIVALLAAASLVVGVVSVLALRGFLMDRLDEQLYSATGRTQNAAQGDPGNAPVPLPPGGATTLPQFGVQAPLTITALAQGDVVIAGIVSPSGDIHYLVDEIAGKLLAVPTTGEPVSINLGGELGEYRFSAGQTLLGTVVMTGLPQDEVNATLNQLIAVIGVVTLLALAAAAAAGAVVVRLALRPLERVVATASHVAELPLDRGEVALAVRVPDADADPRTEVGQVGAAINRMLGHVGSALSARQASENKVRRFVADASHELRTPLASIRGYAELTRRSGHKLPDDVVHSISRVESEAVRMTSLVEDLLLLARLDEGRDLERGTVEISRLLIDTLGDAQAAGPEHEWVLELPEEPMTIIGDPQRLHQVVANLLTNARVHTPPTSRIEVTLAPLGESDVVITVSDNGPGIDPELLPQLFERFARGDSSRSRAAGSTGLGLAIVRAVVDGHGGEVSVESEPGRTEFRVRLPRA